MVGGDGVRGAMAGAALLALALTASGHRTYTVRPGDTLSEIAAALRTTVAALTAANGITDPDRIYAGQKLSLPKRDRRPPVRVHVVRRGENLTTIARRYGLSVAALARANGLADPNHLLAGSRLRITTAPPPAPGRTGWRCPVAGTVRFHNDFGVAKPDGRFHEGVDLFAPRGTPVVAPVPGLAERVRGSRGGLQVWLYGDDGMLYVAAHLDRFATGGPVAAGTIVGFVGTSGNAAATAPHLHFEMIDSGGTAINPYPMLRAACR